MHLYVKTFYNIIRHSNNFDWIPEHQKHFDEIKTLHFEEISNLSQIRFRNVGALLQ